MKDSYGTYDGSRPEPPYKTADELVQQTVDDLDAEIVGLKNEVEILRAQVEQTDKMRAALQLIVETTAALVDNRSMRICDVARAALIANGGKVNDSTKEIDMSKRFIVEVVDRPALDHKHPGQRLEDALNDPKHDNHGLEQVYAIESATVIVWRQNTLL
jgi:hypothetical protein